MSKNDFSFAIDFIHDYLTGQLSSHSFQGNKKLKVKRLNFLTLCDMSYDIDACYKRFLNELDDLEFTSIQEPFPSKAEKIKKVISLFHHSQNSSKESCKSCLELFNSSSFVNELCIFAVLILFSSHNDFSPEIFISTLYDHLGSLGEDFIKAIVLCFPERYEFLMMKLHTYALACQSSNSELKYRKVKLLILMIKKFSGQPSEFIIEKCIYEKCTPDILLSLLFDEYADCNRLFISAMNRLLIYEESCIRDWFATHVKQLQQNQDHQLVILCKKLSDIASQSLYFDGNNAYLKSESVSECISLLQCVAALKAYCNLEYDPLLSPRVFQLITAQTVVSEKSVHFIKFSICFFLAMRQFLISENSGPLENSHGFPTGDADVILWIQRLLKEQVKYSEDISIHSSYSELLLLLSTLFQVNSSTAITETINSIVGVKFSSIGRVIGISRKLFTQNLFTERLIASQVSMVPATESLSENLTGYLPIHCVLPLLQSHAFLKSNVNISDWIFKQLQYCMKPVHPLVPDMIDAYIESITNPPASKRYDIIGEEYPVNSISCKYILESKIVGLFENSSNQADDNECNITPQLLMLYYLLGLYDAQLKRRMLYKSKKPRANSFFYSEAIFDIIPVKYLLNYSRRNLSAYQHLYPKLLHLVASHLPHLITGELIIQDELLFLQSRLDASVIYLDQSIEISQDSEALVICKIDSMITSSKVSVSDIAYIVKYLKHLHVANDGVIINHTNLIASKIPKLLCFNREASDNKYLCKYFVDLWRRVHLLMPRKVQVLTTNALKCQLKTKRAISWDVGGKTDAQSGKLLKYSDLVADPVENVLMYVDRFVFKSPPLLSIVLRIVECCLLASRSYWLHRVVDKRAKSPVPGEDPNQEQSVTSKSKAQQFTASSEECDRLRIALIVSQDAAVVHILLEFCLPTNESISSKSLISPLREVQQIICTFIHYLYIAEPCLANVVHWQTYPTALLEVATESIPSMHIILDNAIEVFRISSDYQKMSFFLNLLSHLSMYYNIRPTLEKTAFILDAVRYVLVNIVCAEERYGFVLSCLPGLVRLAKCFPILAPKICGLLLRVAMMLKNNSYNLHSAIQEHTVVDALSLLDADNISEGKLNAICYREVMCSFKTILFENASLKHIFLKRIC